MIIEQHPTAGSHLLALINRITCSNCAGAGQLTTTNTFTVMGRLERSTSIKPCRACNGLGVQGTGR